MDRPDRQEPLPAAAGLCETCRNARWVRSDRGSVFLLCLAHKTHPEMPKYPPLPVLRCAVYEEDTDR